MTLVLATIVMSVLVMVVGAAMLLWLLVWPARARHAARRRADEQLARRLRDEDR